jgi:serine/threonine protein phosphatase PrpC
VTVSLSLSGYDLSDEGPGRTVNEDAALVREDLGLFAVADGAGGRGRGDVAANLALRTIENYVGSTVRRSHERPDFDLLGIPEQARRISSAVHQAHANILEILKQDPKREGMATTIVALLFAPRTLQVHIAHVGDSRCYRMRHGRLELLTTDHTIANEILERRPDTPDDVLEQLPRNSVTSALGMNIDFRVAVRTLDLVAGDRFLLCTDGLTTAVSTETIWATLREPEPTSVVVSELLGHALAARSPDNISVLVADCLEKVVDEEIATQRYNEIPLRPPSQPVIEPDDGPNSADLIGPEILAPSSIEPVEDFGLDSELPTAPLLDPKESSAFGQVAIAPEPDLSALGLDVAEDPEEAFDGDLDDEIEVLSGDPLDLQELESSSKKASSDD